MIWFSFKDAKNVGLIKYNPITELATPFNSQRSETRLKDNSIYSLMVDDNNNIWIGHNIFQKTQPFCGF